MSNFVLQVEGMESLSGVIDVFVPPVIHNKLAIIKSLPDTQTYNIEVNAVALQDNIIPVNKLKGHTIPVGWEWMNYLKKIQTYQGWELMRTPYHLWINRAYIGDNLDKPSTDPDIVPTAECISAGYGNFVEILKTITTQGGTFHQLRAFRNNQDTSLLDPLYDNWYYYPQLFGKETARRKDNGAIVNPGNNDDCYFPHLARTDYLWIHDDFVELFPPSPEGGGFILFGASVYTETMKPLRLARVYGELIHPDSRWALNTGSVVPDNPI